MIFGHGNDLHNYKQEIKADFSSNMVNGDLPADLKNHLVKQLNSIRNYPDPRSENLKKAIAQQHQIRIENIHIGNGSTEIFYQLAQAYEKSDSLIIEPSFSEYEDACKRYNHSLSFSLKPESKSISNTDIVWLGNPNNPDGKITSCEEIKNLCRKHKHTYFVIDEAYADLCLNFESAIPLIQNFSNLIVIRSLTKSFAIAGLRLGYLIAHPQIVNNINRFGIPWGVNVLAQEAGSFILRNLKNLLPDIFSIIQSSHSFQKALQKIPELEVISSDCNFFLVELKKGNAAGLKNYLIEEYGFLIRDASNFRSLKPTHFRLASQTAALNALLVKAIEQWLKKLL